MLGYNVENAVITSNTIYLRFPLPMKDNKNYSLSIGSGLVSAAFNPTLPTTLNFTYKEDHFVPSFQLNQQGYLPSQPKFIYVNDYFGDMGGAVFVVGSKGAIYSRDKYSLDDQKKKKNIWRKHQICSSLADPHPISFTKTLRAVAAISETEAIAVGDHGSILRFQGGSSCWYPMISGTTEDLKDIKFTKKGEGFIVGTENTLLYLTNVFADDAIWVPFPAPSAMISFPQIADRNFLSIGVFVDGSFIIGGDGLILIYWEKKWFLSFFDPVASSSASSTASQINCVTGAFQRTATDRTLSFGENGFHSRTVYGNQASWSWNDEMTLIRSNVPSSSSLNLTKVSWNGCWNNHFNFAFTLVGSNGTILLGSHPGGNGEYAVMTGLIEGSWQALDCIHAYDCYAVGTDGAIASGAISRDNEDIPSGWSTDWEVDRIVFEDEEQPIDFFGVAAVMEGSLRLTPSQRVAYLVDADDITQEYLTIPLTMHRMNDVSAGGDIWTADFSSFTTPGQYRLYIKGLGVSHPFAIAEDALTLAAWHSCRAFYYQRSATALTTPFADSRWTRPIDHEFNTTKGGRRIDAAYHWSLKESLLYKGEMICPLENTTCSPESMKDVAGGWFDAGDFGKYIMGSASVTWRHLNSFEMHPSNYSDDWNIPESGNGIADIVDETQWELNWMEKMQTDDGGFYNKVAAEVWENRLPQVADLGGHSVRYILEQATGETAIAGAAFAQASRVFLALGDQQTSDRYLDRAIRAYSFLQKYPTDVPVGGVFSPVGHVSGAYNDNDDRDNRCWFVAELYRSTCELHFAVEFEKLFQANLCGIGWLELQQSGTRAQWAYYNAASSCPPKNRTTTNEEARSTIKRNFEIDLNDMFQHANEASYPTVLRMDILQNIDAYTTIYQARDLLMDVVMFPERQKEIEKMMRRHVDLSLGANALSRSFVTGLGYDRVRHPLQWSTRTTTERLNLVDEPCPGFNIFGPSAHLPYSNFYWRTAYSDVYNYPSMWSEDSPFPVLRRFVDHPYMAGMTEFGIGMLGPQCAVLMYLKNSSFEAINAAIRPTSSPTALPLSSFSPTVGPSLMPTKNPVKKTTRPSFRPSKKPVRPTVAPTTVVVRPSVRPTKKPTTRPTTRSSTKAPNFRKTHVPTSSPTKKKKKNT
jgi:hypothetical protein